MTAEHKILLLILEQISPFTVSVISTIASQVSISQKFYDQLFPMIDCQGLINHKAD
jgi:hypothetical protein